MDAAEEAWSDYHDEFIKRKNEMLSKLATIANDSTTNEVYKSWCKQISEFINEQKG